MATTIKLKNGSGAPLAGDLVAAEPAFDLTNKRLYTEDSGGTVIEVGTNPSTIDINAGTIDGTVIGGSSAAAGTFTTFTSTGIDDNATSTALTVTDSGIAATLTTAAQPNITSVGTLTGFTSTGIDDNATSTAITIDSSENVGIGETSPDSVLHVNSGTGNNTAFFESTDNGAIVSIADNAGSIQLRAIDTGDFVVQVGGDGATTGTNSTEAMRIDSSGNVGIGTASPSSTLHLYGTGSPIRLNIEGTTGRVESRLDNTSGAFIFGIDDSGGAGFGSAYSRNIYSNGAYPMLFWTNNAERMRIDSSGNVGIGVTPDAWRTTDSVLQLGNRSSVADLANDAHFSNNAYFATGGTWKAQDTAQATNYYQSAGIHVWRYAGTTTADAAISWSEAMRIDSSGNLLVGKASSATNVEGGEVRENGQVLAVATDINPFFGARLGSDGDLAVFRKDTTTVGSIFSYNGFLGIGSTSGNDAYLIMGSDFVAPATSTGAARDGAIDLGSSTRRFKDLYLSGGAYLGGTGAANKLDDYEEGLHVTTLTPGTSGTITLNSSFDTLGYTKIGRLVHITGSVTVSSVSSPVGNIQVSLPFVIASTSEQSERFGGLVPVNRASINVNEFAYAGTEGLSYIEIYKASGTEISNDSAETFSGNEYIYFDFTYYTT